MEGRKEGGGTKTLYHSMSNDASSKYQANAVFFERRFQKNVWDSIFFYESFDVNKTFRDVQPKIQAKPRVRVSLRGLLKTLRARVNHGLKNVLLID